MTLFWILAGISALFFVLLGTKALFNMRFCALCLASSLVWVALLAMYWLRVSYIVDPTVIALLAGATMLGIYYLAERRVADSLLVFRLPFYLTMFAGFAWLLGGRGYSYVPVVFLAGLWLLFLLIYALREAPRIKSIGEHIIACCKDW